MLEKLTKRGPDLRLTVEPSHYAGPGPHGWCVLTVCIFHFLFQGFDMEALLTLERISPNRDMQFPELASNPHPVNTSEPTNPHPLSRTPAALLSHTPGHCCPSLTPDPSARQQSSLAMLWSLLLSMVTLFPGRRVPPADSLPSPCIGACLVSSLLFLFPPLPGQGLSARTSPALSPALPSSPVLLRHPPSPSSCIQCPRPLQLAQEASPEFLSSSHLPFH